MSPGDVFLRRLAAARTFARREAGRRRFALSSALLAPAATTAAIFVRVEGASPGRALGAASVVALACTFVAAVSALVARRRAGAASAVVDRIDRELRAEGLCAAAWHVARAPDAGRLAPAVLAAADRAAATLPEAPRRRFGARRRLRRLLAFWLLAALAAFAPIGPYGAFGGAGEDRGRAGAEGPRPAPGAPRGADGEHGATDDERPDLRDLVRLTLVAAADVVAEQDEIYLTVDLETLQGVGASPPLELMLAMADGLPSPDVGFGVGFRAGELPAGWTLPAEKGGRRRFVVGVLASLKDAEMYRSGLFTFFAATRVADPTAPVRGGAVSNTIVVQVAPRFEPERQERPKESPEEKRENRSEGPPKPGAEQTPTEGRKPKLGAPTELPEVDVYDSLVRPLFNEGPTVEKDLSVYEREEGGDAPPPPPAPERPASAPSRSFARRPEIAAPRPALTPEERDALRRYFERLRAEGAR